MFIFNELFIIVELILCSSFASLHIRELQRSIYVSCTLPIVADLLLFLGKHSMAHIHETPARSRRRYNIVSVREYPMFVFCASHKMSSNSVTKLLCVYCLYMILVPILYSGEIQSAYTVRV